VGHAIDLTGGLDPGKDWFFAARPDDPQMRESASVWVSDDAGAIALPRLGIEAMADRWDARGVQVNVAFPDGRAVIVRDLGEGRSPVDTDGVCRTFAAGGLTFHCDEPFTRHTITYDGTAVDTTADVLALEPFPDAERVPLHVELVVEAAVPPWVSGTLNADAKRLFDEGFAGMFISPRYEQLCNAEGRVRIGPDEWTFTGGALRIHRQGPRDVGGFWGHCWASGLFPSGRGFGALAFPPRSDGQPTFNEGYVFDGGRMVPATLIDAPWLRRLRPCGDDVSLTLRTADGDVRIEGETIASSCMPAGWHAEFAPALQQAAARYHWEGEHAYGMTERSIPGDQLEP
jgi:hypothetical protein